MNLSASVLQRFKLIGEGELFSLNGYENNEKRAKTYHFY